MEYTKRHNVNRGYMKLNVWNEAIDLFAFVSSSIANIEKLDLRLKSQILDSAQSVSANIAEGYCRRTLKEYIQYLNIGLGSMGETMTRMIGLMKSGQLSPKEFTQFDEFHYSVENKLLALVRSLQSKKGTHDWIEKIPDL